MKFTEAWDQLKRKQPKLSDPQATVEITSVQFERLLGQFYDLGAAQEKAVQEMKAKIGDALHSRFGF